MSLDVDIQRADRPSVIAVTPDGSRLAFAIGDTVHVREQVDGRDLYTVATRAAELRFAASGELAIMTTQGIVVVSPQGERLLEIEATDFAEARFIGVLQRMAWTPAGDLVVRDDAFDLWLVRVADGARTRLTKPGTTLPLRASSFGFLADGRLVRVDRTQVAVGELGDGPGMSWWTEATDDDDPPSIERSAIVGEQLVVQDEDGLVTLLSIGNQDITPRATFSIGDSTWASITAATNDGVLAVGAEVARWTVEPVARVASAAVRLDRLVWGGGRTIAVVGSALYEYDSELTEIASVTLGANRSLWGVGFAGAALLVGCDDAVRRDNPEGDPLLYTSTLFGQPIAAANFSLQLSGCATGLCAATRHAPEGVSTSGTTVVSLRVGQSEHVIDTESHVHHRFSWTADGSELWAVAAPSGLVCVDTATGNVRTIETPPCNGYVLPVVSNEHVVAAAKGGSLVIVERSTGQLRLVETGMSKIAPTVRSLAVGDDRARILNPAKNELLEVPLDGSPARVVCTLPQFSDERVMWSLSPSGRRIVGGEVSGERIVVVDDTGEIIATGSAQPFEARFGQKVWSDDGRIAWVAVDGSIVVIQT